MSGINKVILIGRLGLAPEARETATGATVTNISVATSEKWKDKNTGAENEKTEWHRVVFFNRLAEVARDYLKKGSSVYVHGKLKTRKWEDSNGTDRYTTEIIANEMQMLDGRNSSSDEFAPKKNENTAKDEFDNDNDLPF